MKGSIHKQRVEKCQVAEMMNLEPRKPPINYAKKNYDKIQQKQANNRQRAADEEEKLQSQKNWKIKRFENVESRLTRNGDVKEQPKSTRSNSMRGSAGAQRRQNVPAPVHERAASGGPMIVTIDPNYDPANVQPEPQRNHETENQAPGQSAARAQNKNYGKVPAYMKGIKKELAQDKERKAKAIEDANNPPGMRLMTEDERLETLQMLITAKDEAMLDYNKLPIAANNMAIKQRRQDLEDKIQEVEKAIKTFTRPKVYVAL